MIARVSALHLEYQSFGLFGSSYHDSQVLDLLNVLYTTKATKCFGIAPGLHGFLMFYMLHDALQLSGIHLKSQTSSLFGSSYHDSQVVDLLTINFSSESRWPLSSSSMTLYSLWLEQLNSKLNHSSLQNCGE